MLKRLATMALCAPESSAAPASCALGASEALEYLLNVVRLLCQPSRSLPLCGPRPGNGIWRCFQYRTNGNTATFPQCLQTSAHCRCLALLMQLAAQIGVCCPNRIVVVAGFDCVVKLLAVFLVPLVSTSNLVGLREHHLVTGLLDC